MRAPQGPVSAEFVQRRLCVDVEGRRACPAVDGYLGPTARASTQAPSTIRVGTIRMADAKFEKFGEVFCTSWVSASRRPS